jgi:hypothetical protein
VAIVTFPQSAIYVTMAGGRTSTPSGSAGSQIEHLLETAEAIRKDGRPWWFILTGLIHDLGKILCLYGEPQWAVVGDRLPVGCACSDKIVYPETKRCT